MAPYKKGTIYLTFMISVFPLSDSKKPTLILNDISEFNEQKFAIWFSAENVLAE